MRACLLVLGVILAGAGLAGCHQRVEHSAAEVEAAMGHYDITLTAILPNKPVAIRRLR